VVDAAIKHTKHGIIERNGVDGQMADLLDPRNDFVFKRIFGSEENKDVLLVFLNRTFAESGEQPLTEIVLLNPYTDKDAPLDKQSIFDIWAKTAEGKLINIEMQLFNKYDIEKRTLYYWSKRYSSQLQEGQTYKELKKCVCWQIELGGAANEWTYVEARRLYEERQKYLHDEASMIEWATEKGLAEGEKRKAIEIAKNMLSFGIEVSVIAKTSGLTESEVEALKD